MLRFGYVDTTNLAHHLLFLFRQIFGETTSTITPKMFLESHLPRSTSGTRTFTVLLTFPGGNFSLERLIIFNACGSKLLFIVFLFSESRSYARHTLMENGLLLLTFLQMGGLLHLFLLEQQQLLALTYLHYVLSHYWSHSGFLNEFFLHDSQ